MWCHVFFCWFHIMTMVNAWVFVDAYNFSDIPGMVQVNLPDVSFMFVMYQNHFFR